MKKALFVFIALAVLPCASIPASAQESSSEKQVTQGTTVAPATAVPSIETWKLEKRTTTGISHRWTFFKLFPLSKKKFLVTIGDFLTFKDPVTKQRGYISVDEDGNPFMKIWGEKGKELAAIKTTENIWRIGSYALVRVEIAEKPLRAKTTLVETGTGKSYSVEVLAKCLDARIAFFCAAPKQ